MQFQAKSPIADAMTDASCPANCVKDVCYRFKLFAIKYKRFLLIFLFQPSLFTSNGTVNRKLFPFYCLIGKTNRKIYERTLSARRMVYCAWKTPVFSL